MPPPSKQPPAGGPVARYDEPRQVYGLRRFEQQPLTLERFYMTFYDLPDQHLIKNTTEFLFSPTLPA